MTFVSDAKSNDVAVVVSGASAPYVSRPKASVQRGPQSRARRVLEREQDLEQRVAAEVALRRERLDQPLEGQVLVGVGVRGRSRARARSSSRKAGRRQVGAQHQGVDEEADQALELGAGAAGDRRADRRCPSWPL